MFRSIPKDLPYHGFTVTVNGLAASRTDRKSFESIICLTDVAVCILSYIETQMDSGYPTDATMNASAVCRGAPDAIRYCHTRFVVRQFTCSTVAKRRQISIASFKIYSPSIPKNTPSSERPKATQKIHPIALVQSSLITRENMSSVRTIHRPVDSIPFHRPAGASVQPRLSTDRTPIMVGSVDTSTTGPATSSQAVAMAMTYELLIRAIQLPVVILLALSIVLRLSYRILDPFTSHHTLIALTLTGILTKYSRAYIQRIAPSPKDAYEGLKKVEITLPLFLFLLVCGLCKYCVSPLGRMLQIQDVLTWSPCIPWSWMCRAILGCLALSLSVVVRYIGPPSVMRCSSCPLLEHPLQTSIRMLVSNTTVDKILQQLTAPTLNSNAMRTSSSIDHTWDYRGKARRFQAPMLTAMMAQVLLTTLCALIVAYASVLPMLASLSSSHHQQQQQHDHDASSPFEKTCVILTCLGASLGHLTHTALALPELHLLRLRRETTTTKSHPSMSTTSTMTRGFWDIWRSPTRTTTSTPPNSLMVTTLVSSIIVVGLAMWTTTFLDYPHPSVHYNHSDDDNNNSHRHHEQVVSYFTWTHCLNCMVTGAVTFVYLDLFDRFIQFMITNYAKDVHQVIFEVTDDRSIDAVLEIVVQSLAHSDPILTRSLSEPSTLAYADLERHEAHRHEQACQILGERLTSQSFNLHQHNYQHHPVVPSAPLEEDVLRITILAQYGDGVTLEDMSALTKVHIERWINPVPLLHGGQPSSFRGEPSVVPLTRAIAAYIGGLGHALLKCSSHSSSTSAISINASRENKQLQQKYVSPSSNNNPWAVAPGTIACATYAVRAGGRLLLHNSRNRTASNAGGYTYIGSGRLSMLIPVFLSALYTLESAMIQYAKNKIFLAGGSPHFHGEAGDMFRTEYPEFLPISVAIAEVSMALILEGLPSRDILHLRHLSPDCSRWVDELFSKRAQRTSSSPASPPGLLLQPPAIQPFERM